MVKMPKKGRGGAENAKPATSGATETPGNDGRSPRHAARKRRTGPTLLVGLAVVAVGGMGFLVMGRGGLEQARPPAGPAPVTSPSVGGELIAPGEATPTPSTFELSEARDPFRPLVVPAPEGAAAASPGSTAGASPTPSPGAGSAGSSAPEGGQEVELLDVVDDQGTTKAQVKVGSTVSTIAAGETFASTYELVSIQGTCATLQNGTDTFTLCKGDQALK